MIKIQNIYYMLSYAFQILKEQGYKHMGTEEFHNTPDLMAEILIRGFSIQVKRGLIKEYVPITEPLNNPKGKIDISESIKGMTIQKKQLVCSYDDFSVNAYMNRIIKTTMEKLLRSQITLGRKKELKRLLNYLADVDVLELSKINWNVPYNQSNQTYRMLISICELTIKGLLQTTTDGSKKMMDYLDEQRMCRLYEKFILAYYSKEYPKLTVNSSQIKWAIDEGQTDMLPTMQSDIMLSLGEKVLIIDAKYYSHTTQSQFGTNTIHSGNLYQIFTYVKNKDRYNTGNVAGMLLYAKTDELVQPNQEYVISNNKIWVKTLDLNLPFEEIATQLDRIADAYFGEKGRDTFK